MGAAGTDPLVHLQTTLAERYTIGRQLGRGGMATVYLARDLRHGRDVAIKVLRPDLAAGLGIDRFLREIRIEAALQHPHILGLIDSGILEYNSGPKDTSGLQLPYYVMPFIPGESLRDRLAREKQLPLADTIRIARDVGDALSHAHAHGVIHRDIKPGNILLSEGHAWVADFGIARAITVAAGEELTETGLAIGTPDYMSPEQASAEAGIDGRSDVYALGCVVYEMLTGEPPFHGRTAQAILARHRIDPPPSLRVVRPTIPEHVESAVIKALAKVPADRYLTTADFVADLERPQGVAVASKGHVQRRVRPALIAAATLLGLAGLWLYVTRGGSAGLDPNRVVVFPLDEGSRSAISEASGEAVATYIGYALEGTAPLKWLDGRDFLSPAQRASLREISPAEAREISRQKRAAYYLDGSILRVSDSVTVVLRLHDVAGDSVLKRTGASGQVATASLPQLGLRAMAGLMPILLEPGRRVDVSALSERQPDAIANFLQGEREYRQMRFGRALDHYHSAVQEDSSFALAALKGGQSAGWLERSADAQSLLAVSVRHKELLPAKYKLYAEGLSAYWSGDADSAVSRFRRAIAVDSSWSDAWMALGEVYYHLLPRGSSLDSLAEDAFNRTRRLDADFTPPLYHLVALALHRGNVTSARTYIAELRAQRADSTLLPRLTLMYDCVVMGPEKVDWRRAVEQDPTAVLEVAQPLATSTIGQNCARKAYRAVLGSANIENRWGALLGLQGILVAEGRRDELGQLFASQEAADLPGRRLYLWDASADAGLDGPAEAAAVEVGTNYGGMEGPNLWLLGQWASHRRDVEPVRAISAVLAARVAGGTRLDSLFARIMAAYSALVDGDTTVAIDRLSALTPSASRADLTWQPWEALAGERLTLAELFLARKRYFEADSLAAALDNHRSVAFLIYLPASLRVRIRVAEAMGRPDMANRYRRRLTALSQSVSSEVHSNSQ